MIMSMITVCSFCGAEFEAERSSARYCCDSHKVLFHRQLRQQEEMEYQQQQRQADFIETKRRIANAQKQKDEQIKADFDEIMRIASLERKAQQEQRTKIMEQQRLKDREKKKIQNEKSSEKANLKLKLAGVGILSAIGLATLLLNNGTESDSSTKLADEMQPATPHTAKTPVETEDIDNSEGDKSSPTPEISIE
jgi:DNA-directed RNA polymerase subunit RPC12/RpoP